MDKDEYEYKIDILCKEWDYYQTGIGRYDTILFNIRGWSITIFTGILGASVALKSPLLILTNIVPALLFWLIDSINKNFQGRYIERCREIEDYMSSNKFRDDLAVRRFDAIQVPKLSQAFAPSKNRTFRGFIISIVKAAKIRNVMLVHLAIILMSLTAFVILLISSY